MSKGRTRLRAPLLILALGGMAAGTGAGAAERAFSFRDAEFLPQDEALATARAFVARRLPAGLAFAQAIARTRAAGMGCGRLDPSAGVVCRYGLPVHEPGGIIGEDVWTLSLRPAADGTLGSADLDYRRDGVPR